MFEYPVVDGFDGLLFAIIDDYRAEKFAQHDELIARVAMTRILGDIFWTDHLRARERLVLDTITARNQTPSFHALYLNFLLHPEWIGRTDAYLTRFRAGLSRQRWQPMVGGGALLVTGIARNILFDLAAEPRVFLVAALVLAMAATVAGWLAARRVDPLIALGHE
ncbi:MAG: hypothetical protein DMF84_29625 [Acidobacteria bacterium]|nr:MAG: hypothetical protein DMF84_29625 [Acidobacteriota bacterium]